MRAAMALRSMTAPRARVMRDGHPPSVLFEGDIVVSSLIPGVPFYDVAPDGRFLMVARSGEQQLPAQREVVLNWVADVAVALLNTRRKTRSLPTNQESRQQLSMHMVEIPRLAGVFAQWRLP